MLFSHPSEHVTAGPVVLGNLNKELDDLPVRATALVENRAGAVVWNNQGRAQEGQGIGGEPALPLMPTGVLIDQALDQLGGMRRVP